MKALLIFAAALAFGSCRMMNCTEGSGNIVTKTYEQDSFDRFDLSSSADVELIPSTRNAVEVSTYENILEKLKVENKGGEVSLDFEGCVSMVKTMKVKVFFTKLSAVDITGSGDIVSNDTLRGDHFEISITGSGDIKILANYGSIDANIIGSGDISLKGTTGQLRGKINGSGDINATGLYAGSTDILINGSGDANLGNCANLSSRVNGSGHVNCKGK